DFPGPRWSGPSLPPETGPGRWRVRDLPGPRAGGSLLEQRSAVAAASSGQNLKCYHCEEEPCGSYSEFQEGLAADAGRQAAGVECHADRGEAVRQREV